MGAWITDFFEQTDLNRFPVALRTEGGIGFQVGKDIISNFVGHPVHYWDAGEWKPITLVHEDGHFEGCRFGWNGYAVTCDGYILFQPQSITFNGIARPLTFFRDGQKMVSYVPNIGTYEIIFSEAGVREVLVIPEPLEGELSFQVAHTEGWEEYLYIKPRQLLGTNLFGDVYQLTPDMNYPLTIDPDYAGDTSDGTMYSNDVTTFASARNTSDTLDTAGANLYVGMNKASSADWWVYRSAAKFNTSGIPDADTISQVNMKLTCTSDSSTTDFDVVIRKYNWSASDPLGSGNRETVFDGILAAASDTNIWRNTSGMSVNTQYTSGNLTTSWVSATGSTYYGLISSRDVSNTTPTGPEQINIGSQDNATSAYRPVLTVAHSGSGTRAGRLSLLGVG